MNPIQHKGDHSHGEHLPVAVIGGGPAGLMAAEVLTGLGHQVHLFDAMPSVGRKFLLAGRGGLNLTHAEPMPEFVRRFTDGAEGLLPMLSMFGNQAVRDWAMGLGQDTFVGTSKKVFPVGMKASPLLRAWLLRLQNPEHGAPVRFHLRHRWVGWEGDAWVFTAPDGPQRFTFGCVVLALGGGSWPRLGSTGAWVDVLQGRGVETVPLKPSNCGFDVAPAWTAHFRSRFAGKPLKSVAMTVRATSEPQGAILFDRKGECVVTETGLEGNLVYAASASLRQQLEQFGEATAFLDLLPDHTPERVWNAVSQSRGGRSLSTHLKSRLGLEGVKLGLIYELLDQIHIRDAGKLAACIKSLPLRFGAPRPLGEAISSAGGVAWSAMDSAGMLSKLPGVFCAGEMLNWDAPTGGYLLTACLASGRSAGLSAHRYLERGGNLASRYSTLQ